MGIFYSIRRKAGVGVVEPELGDEGDDVLDDERTGKDTVVEDAGSGREPLYVHVEPATDVVVPVAVVNVLVEVVVVEVDVVEVDAGPPEEAAKEGDI